mmetsp:Transcript_8784/g.1233  ORF Transcript_8784/g.1233 Transcript_8784/m.1233 type:complete len:116 (+) Transcript_8784:177-524(+)
MIAFTYYCVLYGDPNRLIHGYDFRAELCGMNDLDDFGYVYFPRPNDSLDLRICLDGCPVVDAPGVVCLYEPDHTTPHSTTDCFDAYESRPYFNRYCLPSDDGMREEVIDYWNENQ